MKKSALKLVPPSNVKQTVDMARRRPNAELRTREYLTEPEIERMLAAVKGNRWAQRDATMLLVAFRHGLRVAELVDLRWDQIEFENGRLHVRRAKNGTPSVHPIHGDELRALRKLQREQDPVSPFVFTTERGGPFSVSAFQRLVLRAGEAAGLGFAVHPHMLRHGHTDDRDHPFRRIATTCSEQSRPAVRRGC